MALENILQQAVQRILKEKYAITVPDEVLQFQKTRSNYEGDITLVVFPLTKMLRLAPPQIAAAIGDALCQEIPNIVQKYNAVQGFLNLSITPQFWLAQLHEIYRTEHYGIKIPAHDAPLMMVEYSSPNTNKPLHLGHIRNNLLGWAIAQIAQANGWKVVKTNIVNDRGIHICKSMIAWQKFGNGETPQSTGKKGDHLVGDYYVRFDKEYKTQIAQMMEHGSDEETAKRGAPIMQEAQEMLRRWERGDEQTRTLWNTMNRWVYDGFDETYARLQVGFDKIYYESETYLEGKKEVLRGVEEGIFTQRTDGSVWADLTPQGLDEKLLLRADGTSVYITQDIGTAKMRYQDFPIDKMVYVVGNEQEYHFKVLAILLDKLGFRFGKDLVHFSYGMVELPNGKMKSREGTVVDADELITQMETQARQISKDKVNTLQDITSQEADDIARKVGLGALKYYILKVDPRKTILFNPQESIDFNGNTGPFIQYTYARIQSILRKSAQTTSQDALLQPLNVGTYDMSPKELNLIQRLCDYPATVEQAGKEFSPAIVANYAYDIAALFNSFYHDHSILNEGNVHIQTMRIVLCSTTAKILDSAMNLLGIEMPQRM